jgi:hypothetical protein
MATTTLNSRYAEFLAAERQYDAQRNIVRLMDLGLHDHSRDVRRYNGAVAGAARWEKIWRELFDTFTNDELRAFGEYRRTH